MVSFQFNIDVSCVKVYLSIRNHKHKFFNFSIRGEITRFASRSAGSKASNLLILFMILLLIADTQKISKKQLKYYGLRIVLINPQS